MDLKILGESPCQINDQIKDVLFAKSAERNENLKPVVASTLFGEDELAETEDEITEEDPEEEE